MNANQPETLLLHLSQQTLKAGLHRHVFVAEGRDGASELVKRFEGRGPWKRLGDGRRARREFELLRKLHAAGVPVPRPGELRRRASAWEFTCEYLEGGVSLEALLENRMTSEQGSSPEQLARSLGEALAKAHIAGLDHGDLHAGNLLFDAHGKAHFIDFGKAKLRAALDARSMLRDLVCLAAATRERCCESLRRRALLAWRRALPASMTATLPADSELARCIESRSAIRRAKIVFEHRDRWLRESGRCRLVGRHTLVVRNLGEGDAAAISAMLEAAGSAEAGSPEATPTHRALPHPSDQALEVLIFEGGAALREGWAELGRALEHALPALQPMMLLDEARVRAAFSAPRESVKCSASGAACSELNAKLRDRKLREVLDHASLYRAPNGELLLGPTARLVQVNDEPQHA